MCIGGADSPITRKRTNLRGHKIRLRATDYKSSLAQTASKLLVVNAFFWNELSWRNLLLLPEKGSRMRYTVIWHSCNLHEKYVQAGAWLNIRIRYIFGGMTWAGPSLWGYEAHIDPKFIFKANKTYIIRTPNHKQHAPLPDARFATLLRHSTSTGAWVFCGWMCVFVFIYMIFLWFLCISFLLIHSTSYAFLSIFMCSSQLTCRGLTTYSLPQTRRASNHSCFLFFINSCECASQNHFPALRHF